MKLATYTKAEGMVLEDHYIKGYEAEGLVGKGKPPVNDKKQPFNITPAGIARIKKARASKEEAYRLISQGHDTVRAVATIMRRTDTPVRRYFRKLEMEGRIKMVTGGNGLPSTWSTT